MDFSHRKEIIDSVTVFHLSGNLMDKNQAEELIKETHRIFDSSEKKVVIDLQEVKYMNSTGLNILVNMLTKAKNTGGKLVISTVSKKVNQLLLITKLNTVFVIADDVTSALRKF